MTTVLAYQYNYSSTVLSVYPQLLMFFSRLLETLQIITTTRAINDSR